MATTKNHKITQTVKKAIDYAIGDKVEEAVKDDIADSIAYSINDKTGKVTYQTIHSTLNCRKGHPYETFKMLINEYGRDEVKNGNKQTKDGAPVLAWHFHQNFEGHVDPIIANEIGVKLAKEMFPNFSVVIGTHTNTENIHNHIIVCAWNLDGKKWNQHNAEYRRLRQISDRLCEEYGLSVLNETRNQKLLKYKDKDGNTHYYEPTDRKNDLIRQRESGEISTDDVGSYRNTISYENSENIKEANYEIIRHDIDRLLPVANSYEHLLQMLRQIGYTVNDKKKNGEWLKHISFQPPTADKATRDYKISDGGFYLRENLEKVIGEFVFERNASTEADNNKQHEIATESKKSEIHTKTIPPYFEEYILGETDISDIDENVRTVKNADGNMSIVNRSEAEKNIVRDLKVKNSELRLIDTTVLDRLIQEQKKSGKGNKKKKREEIILSQIQDSFSALRFMERENLYSQKQINSITAGIWDRYNECIKNLDKLETVISHLETVLEIPQKVTIIEARIERMKNNQDYVENEMESDIAQLKLYRETMQKYKMSSPDSIYALKQQVEKSSQKIAHLQSVLSAYQKRLSEYDMCVSVLDRIDREYGRDNTDMMNEYLMINKRGSEEAKQTKEKRSRRKAAER